MGNVGCSCALFELLLQFVPGLGSISSNKGLGKGEQVFAVRCWEDNGCGFVANVFVSCGHELVKEAHGVTYATIAFVYDAIVDGIIDRDVFFFAYCLEMVFECLIGDFFELVSLAARDNCFGEFVQLCGRKNKDNVCWWFFECLKECVEGTVGEHVYLVDNKHFVC